VLASMAPFPELLLKPGLILYYFHKFSSGETVLRRWILASLYGFDIGL
jgi:hypothetical protein